MLITNHVLAGAGIGAAVPHWGAATAAGFVSHFVLDAVPHFGPGHARRGYWAVARRDGVVGLTAASLLTWAAPPEDRWRVAATIAAACAPDSDKPIRMVSGRSGHPGWFRAVHQGVQTEHRFFRVEVAAAALLGAAAVTAVGWAHYRRVNRRTSHAFLHDGSDWSPTDALNNAVAAPGPWTVEATAAGEVVSTVQT